MNGHTRNSPKTDLARYSHEVLFATNLAFVVVLAKATTSFFEVEEALQYRINALLHLPPHSNTGGYTAISVLALALGACIFVLLRTFYRTALSRITLRYIAGGTSLLGLPLYWLYDNHLFPSLTGNPNPPKLILVFELVAAVALALFFLLRSAVIPGWTWICLLMIHFCFWGWLFIGNPNFWVVPFECLFPALGLASAVAWGNYVSRQRLQQVSDSTVA